MSPRSKDTFLIFRKKVLIFTRFSDIYIESGGRGGMVDTLVLEANAEKRGGSSPLARTKKSPTKTAGDFNLQKTTYSAVLFVSSVIRAFLPNNLRK